ncbi:MAG: glycosyltransferase family 2 protein [Lachnospiraceae bacterium]|nr:glycosyltransferase family 2 protein [Lachnospiraceae bacterium]
MTTQRVAVIPAYEPNEQLLKLAEEAHQNGFFLLIVDDGSGPDYAEIFSKVEGYGKLISYSQNGGKGYALKRALSWLLENRPGIYTVITLDADGQHTVKDALRLCDMSEEAPDALCLGSRHLPKDAPLRSRFGNDLNRFLFRTVSGTPVYDVQTGMRAFSSSLIPFMTDAAGDRYEYEMNVLLDLVRRDVPVLEMEIETIYIDNNSSSHFKPVRDSFRIYGQILKAVGSFPKRLKKQNKS